MDPDSVFDVQVKRIHAYKRQLLAAFKVMHLYNLLKESPDADIVPHTFLFAGKAAAGYAFAKETIKYNLLHCRPYQCGSRGQQEAQGDLT